MLARHPLFHLYIVQKDLAPSIPEMNTLCSIAQYLSRRKIHTAINGSRISDVMYARAIFGVL